MIDPVTPPPLAGIFGALGATIAENQAWLAELEESSESGKPSDAPATFALPTLGIEGPGFFVLDDHGTALYARSGRFHVAADGKLLDEGGRQVQGFANGADTRAKPQSLQVPLADVAAGRFSRYEIDEGGVFLGIVFKVDPHTGAAVQGKVELGRLCIATFPAPERLSANDALTAVATKSAGAPKYFPAGAAHVGELRRQAPQPSFDAVRDNLRRLWSLSGRAEIEVAIAASNDALARIALNLVK